MLDGVSSSVYGTLLQSRPDIPTPKRRVEFITSFGRDGSDPYDEEVYANTEVELNLFIHGTSEYNASENRDRVFNWFDSGKYMEFVQQYDPTKIYHVMMINPLTFTTRWFMEEHQMATVGLTIKPYKYYRDISPIILTTSGSVTNPYSKQSKPLIRIAGNGDITLTINGLPFILKGVAGHIYIDSENYFAYRDDSGIYLNENRKVYTREYPVLKPGVNTISWSGSVTQVRIEPRWRSLA